ncbi:hypothetical protein [Aquiflexum sp.]|uniref:hypothetical protein n=1 Tax=Aquiflexum sp. TaxID=1872584 RepID=UPI0035946D33
MNLFLIEEFFVTNSNVGRFHIYAPNLINEFISRERYRTDKYFILIKNEQVIYVL